MQDPDFPAVERQESPDSARPFAVTMVAVYEFLKAAGLLLIFSWIWAAHRTAPASVAIGKDALSMDQLLILMPAIALYLVVLGFGVWNLQRWARWLIVPAFALIMPRWITLPIPSKSDFAMLREIVPEPIALLIVALDILVVWVLLSPDVRRAFGDVDSDMPWDI